MAVHDLHTFLAVNQQQVLLKLDVENAFNSITMLKEVHSGVPEIDNYLAQS